MQTTSQLYKSILSNPSHIKEIRLDVNGETYRENAVVNLQTSNALFSQNSATVGGCVASEIDVSLLPTDMVIPRMAELRPYVRLVLGTEVSEWVPKGVFYIDTRQQEVDTGLLSIHGYDAVMKSEQLYITDSNNNLSWPLTMQTVVDEIATRMGVTIDERTTINPTYRMAKPSEELTMREVLGYIAAAHAANWIINDSGQLRMIGLTDIPPETYFLVDNFGNPLLFGEVRILLD